MLMLPGFVVWATCFNPLDILPPISLNWTPTCQKFWKTIHPKTSPAFLLKDIIERPNPLLWLSLVLFCIFVFTSIPRRHRKGTLFWYITGTTLAVRCMGSFSGLLHYEVLSTRGSIMQQLPWDSGSFFKIFFLSFIIHMPIWNDLTFGFYAHAPSPKLDHEPFQSDNLEEKHSSESKQAFWKPSSTEPSQSSHLHFRDAMLRLAYYHVVDNTLHMIWLRYYWPVSDGASYTAYVSNSEILHLVLLVLMAAWTRVKKDEALEDWHEPCEADVEKCCAELLEVD